jgi:pimeloyl-ACP methyl ester carboxylesterase
MHRSLWLLLLIPILPVAGIVYQRLGARRDRKRLLGNGLLVDAGEGRQMFLCKMGTGEPTVIFESGIAATSQNWTGLQKAVSSFARTVTYDRAGLGWSSASSSARTPSNIVRELRILLERAGVPPPYLLVGHSFGALVVRRFAVEHPGEVAGVVLLDPMRPEEWPPISEAQRGMLAHGMRIARIATPFAHLGIARFVITSQLRRPTRVSRSISRSAGSNAQLVFERVTGEISKMPHEVWPVIAAHWCAPGPYHGLAAHLRAIPDTVREMQATDPIAGIPVLLFTAGDAEPFSSEAVRRIAPDARQVIAKRSRHWVHLDEPDLVLETIRDIIEQIRSAASESGTPKAAASVTHEPTSSPHTSS